MARQDLGKIISEITEINATVDNGVGVPSATATITGTATEKIVNIDFKNLKGDKGDKPENGVDYFTPEEKKQFTAETVKLVTDEGTKQTGLVGEKGVAETGKLTAEGNKQINLVIAEANKVIEQLKSLIAGNPDTSNAQTLSGKSRVEFERDTQALAGKYVGNFPLTTAVKDAVYLVPQTGKFYVCTKEYSGGNLTAPNSNFEELSVYKNRDKLENLSKKIDIKNSIIINPKIALCECYQIGKRIFGNIAIDNKNTFQNGEELIKFGFTSSTTFRQNTNLDGCSLYILDGSNKLSFSCSTIIKFNAFSTFHFDFSIAY